MHVVAGQVDGELEGVGLHHRAGCTLAVIVNTTGVIRIIVHQGLL